MGRLVDYLAAVDEVALARAIPLFPSVGALPWQVFARSLFLGCSTGLSPLVPSSSLLSLGFYKIHGPRKTQSSTAH